MMQVPCLPNLISVFVLLIRLLAAVKVNFFVGEHYAEISRLACLLLCSVKSVPVISCSSINDLPCQELSWSNFHTDNRRPISWLSILTMSPQNFSWIWVVGISDFLNALSLGILQNNNSIFFLVLINGCGKEFESLNRKLNINKMFVALNIYHHLTT